MWIELSSILLSSISAIIYFMLSYRVVIPYFYKFNYPFNNATKFLVAFTFIGFAVVLYFFGTAANMLYKDLCSKNLFLALVYYISLILLSIVYSILVFRFSAIITQISMKENEKAELAKNNFQVAGFHGIVHLFFVLLLTERILEIILSFFAKS